MKIYCKLVQKISKASTHGILLLAVMSSFYACGGKKLSLLDHSGKLVTKSEQQLVADVLEKELEFNTLTTKGKIQFGNKDYTTVFKLIKDSVLQASVRPLLGIELVRLDITPQQITLIDRLSSQYAIVELKNESQAAIAFNFYNLQALLTNQLFIPGQKMLAKDDYKNFSYTISQNNYVLEIANRNAIKYNFWIDNLDRVKNIFITHNTFPASMSWLYEEFVEDDKKYIYPTQIKAIIKYEKLDAVIGITYNKLEIDKDFSVDLSIPKSYTQRNIKEVIASYAKIK